MYRLRAKVIVDTYNKRHHPSLITTAIQSLIILRLEFCRKNINSTYQSIRSVINSSLTLQFITKINYYFQKLTKILVKETIQQPSLSYKKRHEFAINEKSHSRSKNISLRDSFKPTYLIP